jgi:hypothetical protein
VDPVADPLLLRKNMVTPGIEPGTLDLTTRPQRHQPACLEQCIDPVLREPKRSGSASFLGLYPDNGGIGSRRCMWSKSQQVAFSGFTALMPMDLVFVR